jgi:hypothetical protein
MTAAWHLLSARQRERTRAAKAAVENPGGCSFAAGDTFVANAPTRLTERSSGVVLTIDEAQLSPAAMR